MPKKLDFKERPCSECGESFPRSEFVRTRRGLESLRSICTRCHSSQITQFRAERPDYYLVQQHNIRARKLGVPGVLTAREWLELKESYLNRCAYCGCAGKLHLEHMVPISKYKEGYLEATNDISNILPACGMCNRAKHDLPFIIMLGWRNGRLDYTEERIAA